MLAEREGFEPSVPFGTHDFQSCSFDRSDISPSTKNASCLASHSRSLSHSFSLSLPRSSRSGSGSGSGEWSSGGLRKLAEREGFEPPVPLRVHLISNQAQSTRLCHLSINYFCSAAPRRTLRRAAAPHSRRERRLLDRRPDDSAARPPTPIQRPHRARLRIVAAEDQPLDARVDDRAGAHRTRLLRHVQRGADQPPAADRCAASRMRDHLGVCRRDPSRSRADCHRADDRSRRRPRPHPPAPRRSPPRASPRRSLPACTRRQFIARPEGFEPLTLGSVDRCSIQLSYGRKFRDCSGEGGIRTLGTVSRMPP